MLSLKDESQMQAYCMKYSARREMEDAKSTPMKNDRLASQGLCPTCGAEVFIAGIS